MKKIQPFFLLLSVIFILQSCGFGKYRVYKLEQQSEFENKEGMFYFLPRTVVNVEITIEKKDQIKGPYASYSAKYLGISGIINENTTNYSISDIRIKTQNEPDPDKIYFIEFPKCKNRKNQLMISLKENGIIESINVNTDSLPYQIQQHKNTNIGNEFEDEELPFKIFINQNIMEKIDTLFEYIHLDTITIEKQVYKKTMIEKTPEIRAKEASEYIVKLNEYKVNLISGYQEIAYSEETMQLMISGIDQMINDYMTLFTGKTNVQTLTYNFTYIPETSTKNMRFFLFSIDKNNGISDIEFSDPSKNIYIELMPSLTTSKIAEITNNQYLNSQKRKGLYYNIPEKTKLILSKGNGEPIFESSIMINQYGIVHYLPAKQYKVLYFDNSASLRRIQ